MEKKKERKPTTGPPSTTLVGKELPKEFFLENSGGF